MCPLRDYIRCGPRNLENFCGVFRQSSTVYSKWTNQVWIVHILMKKCSGQLWKYIKNCRSYSSFPQPLFFAESGGKHDMMPTTQLQQKRQRIYRLILQHRVFERKFLENITFFVTEINTQQKNRFFWSSKFIWKKIIVVAITCIWKNHQSSTSGCDKEEFKKKFR